MTIEETFKDYHARIKAGGIVAQPSDYFKAGYLFGAVAEIDKQREGRAMLAAAPTPPAPEVSPFPFINDESAIDAAWSVLKPQLGTSSWTVGESSTYRGFFAWGWEARRQYDAPPAPEVEPVAYASKIYGSHKWVYIWHEKDDVQGWINLQHQSRDDITYTGPIPLYTHPASDELVNVVRNTIVALDVMEKNLTIPPLVRSSLRHKVANLRAALDKGKSC